MSMQLTVLTTVRHYTLASQTSSSSRDRYFVHNVSSCLCSVLPSVGHWVSSCEFWPGGGTCVAVCIQYCRLTIKSVWPEAEKWTHPASAEAAVRAQTTRCDSFSHNHDLSSKSMTDAVLFVGSACSLEWRCKLCERTPALARFSLSLSLTLCRCLDRDTRTLSCPWKQRQDYFSELWLWRSIAVIVRLTWRQAASDQAAVVIRRQPRYITRRFSNLQQQFWSLCVKPESTAICQNVKSTKVYEYTGI